MAIKQVGPEPAGSTDAATKEWSERLPFPIPPASGDQLHVQFSGNTGGTSAFASGTQVGTPLFVGAPFPIDAIGVRVSTAQAGVNAKLLLYRARDLDYLPSDLVATGTVSCASTGWVFGTFSSTQLYPGLYYGFIRTDTGTTVRFQKVQNQNTMQGYVGQWSGSSVAWQLPGADVGTYASPNTTLTPSVGNQDQWSLMVIRRA